MYICILFFLKKKKIKKKFFFLYVVFIFSLTLGNTLNVDEEYQIFYLIIGENNGRCNENSHDNTWTNSYAILEDGYINHL